jgi:hypothetical protein
MSDTPQTNDAARPASLPPLATPKPPRQGPRSHAVAWLAALLIIVLAVVGASPYWAPALTPLLPWSRPIAPRSPQPQAPDRAATQLAAIQQQLDAVLALSARVAALESKPTPDASAAVAPLAMQVQQLSARLDQIDTRLAQLAHDEAANAESPERVLMVALASLGNALAGSRPFAAELASVEALGQKRSGWAAALQPLEPAAKTGIPSTAILAQRFSSDVAPAILRAEVTAPSDQQSLGQAVLARLRGLIVIRRVDGSGTGTSPTDRAAAQAQAVLDKGDLAGAVKALNALSGASASAAQPWLADAQSRLDAEQTIAKLGRDLAGDIAAGGG